VTGNSGFFAWQLLVKADAEAAEVVMELFRGPEDDSGHSQALSGSRVGSNVINIDGFLGADFAAAEGFAIDERIRLGSADTIGIDADRKKTEKGEAGLFVTHMNRIGIRKHCKAIVFGKLLQECDRREGFRVKGAIPDFCELFESKRGTEAICEVEVPVTGSDTSFLPIEPTGVFFNGFPDFLWGQWKATRETAQGAGDVHANQDAADIKNDGAEFTSRHRLLTLDTGDGSGSPLIDDL